MRGFLLFWRRSALSADLGAPDDSAARDSSSGHRNIGYCLIWILGIVAVFAANETQPLWASWLSQTTLADASVAQSSSNHVANVAAASRLASLDAGRQSWLQVIGPHLTSEVTQVLAWLSNLLLLWTAAVWLVWLYRRHEPDKQLWRLVQIGIIWLVGILVLVLWENRWLAQVVSQIDPALVVATRPLPIVIVWTAAIVILYVMRGDDSWPWRHYVYKYRDVWVSLILTITVTLLGGIFVYDSVDHRVQGLLVARQLANSSLDASSAAASRISDGVNTIRTDLQNYNSVVAKSQVSIDGSPATSGASTANVRGSFLDLLGLELAQIDGDLSEVISGRDAALAQLDVAIQTESPGPDATMSLTPIRSSLVKVTLPTSNVQTATRALESQIAALKLDPNEPIPAVEMLMTIDRDMTPNVDDMQATSRLTGTAFSAVGAASLALYIWSGVFFAVLVLLPWALVLLFLFRKRIARAAQIRDDLNRLDPQGKLLKRVLDSTRKGRPEDRSATAVAGDDSGSDPQIEEVANGAFSNFEFLVNLAIVTALLGVGWYYVFYPNTITGLAVLIEKGGVITALNDYFVSQLSPLTLGFTGAYFWILATLLRRYFAGDLYPSVLLQASVRILTVFILSLLLGSVADLAHWNQRLVGALAFFAGITPNPVIEGIAKIVAKGTSIPISAKEDAPLTELDGLNLGDESRLLEENIVNVSNMATAQVEQLVLRTHYSTGQIVDWVDQAILYAHCGDKVNGGALERGRWFKPLRSVGIRSATQLLHVAGWPVYNMPRSYVLPPEPNWATLGRIADSVATAQQSTGALPQGVPEARLKLRTLSAKANNMVGAIAVTRDLLFSIELGDPNTVDYVAAARAAIDALQQPTREAHDAVMEFIKAVKALDPKPDAEILDTQLDDLISRMNRAAACAYSVRAWIPAEPPQPTDPDRVVRSRAAISGWFGALSDAISELGATEATLAAKAPDTSLRTKFNAACVALTNAASAGQNAFHAVQRLNPGDPTSFSAFQTARRQLLPIQHHRDAMLVDRDEVVKRVEAATGVPDGWREPGGVRELAQLCSAQVDQITKAVDGLGQAIDGLTAAYPNDKAAANTALSVAQAQLIDAMQAVRAVAEASEEALVKVEAVTADQELTSEMLDIICRAIWPDPNLRYVINFKCPPVEIQDVPVAIRPVAPAVNSTNGKVHGHNELEQDGAAAPTDANGVAGRTLVNSGPSEPSARIVRATFVGLMRTLITRDGA
jgi:hypothetical protein